jgi:hypothetical protein
MHVGVDQAVPHRESQGGDIVDRPPYKRRAIHRARARREKASGQNAPSLSLKKPERIMALLMVMTVCLLVHAALEYRIRQALKDYDATFPDHKWKPFNIRRRVRSFTMWLGLTCFVRQANGRTFSISLRSISPCCTSSASLICGFMTSDIRKNHEGGAECPLQPLRSSGSMIGKQCHFFDGSGIF